MKVRIQGNVNTYLWMLGLQTASRMGISAKISQKDETRSTKMLPSYSLNVLNDATY